MAGLRKDSVFNLSKSWSQRLSDQYFKVKSSYLHCLKPLLDALDWRNDDRLLMEALPYKAKELNTAGFLHVLNLLRYQYRSFKVKLSKLDNRIPPCFFVTADNKAYVVLSANDETITVFNGESCEEEQLNRKDLADERWRGQAYIFTYESREREQESAGRDHWFRRILLRYKGLFIQILGIGLVLNLLSLAAPLFIMSVYDSVISTSSYGMLVSFTIGVVIGLAGIVFLQIIRSRILAYIGARLDVTVGNAIIARILYLPAAMMEGAAVGSQVARVKDFDTVREFFTGPIISLLFEMPFITIFIAVIAILGGTLVFVPLTMALVYGIAVLFSYRILHRYTDRAAVAHSKRQRMLIDMLTHMRVIKYTHSEKTWDKRYQELVADTAFTTYKSSLVNNIINSFSDSIMVLAGLAILGFGVLKILNGTLTVGAMIAIMIIMWRVLGPLKSLFITMSRIDQIRSSVKQINALMNIKPEREPKQRPVVNAKIKGRILLKGVGFRYNPLSEPALLGINMLIPAGNFVAITGPSSAGKSTLLKIILGLYKPQAGAIYIDDRDIRQLDPIGLRQDVAYAPQSSSFFSGTIEDNIRFAKPDATDEEIIGVLRQAGAYRDVISLPGKLQHVLRGQNRVLLSPGLQQKLVMARMFLKKAPIMLIDQAIDDLDVRSQEEIMDAIGKLRGKATVIVVSQQPAQLSAVDRIIMMEKGMIVRDGPRNEILQDLLF